MNYKKLFTMVPALLCLNNSSWGMEDGYDPIKIGKEKFSSMQNFKSLADKFTFATRIVLDGILDRISSINAAANYKYSDANDTTYFKSYKNIDFTRLLCDVCTNNQAGALLDYTGTTDNQKRDKVLTLMKNSFKKNGLFYNALIQQIEALNIDNVLSSQDKELIKNTTAKDINNINREVSNLVDYLSKYNPAINEKQEKIDFITKSGSALLFNPAIYTILNNEKLKKQAKDVAEVNLAFELLKIRLYQAALFTSEANAIYMRYKTILQSVQTGKVGETILNITPDAPNANSFGTYKKFIATYIDRNFNANTKDQTISDRYFAQHLKNSWNAYAPQKYTTIEDLNQAIGSKDGLSFSTSFSDSLDLMLKNMFEDKKVLPANTNIAERYSHELQQIQKNSEPKNKKDDSFVKTYNDILNAIVRYSKKGDNDSVSKLSSLLQQDNEFFGSLLNIVKNGDVSVSKIVNLMQKISKLNNANAQQAYKSLLSSIQNWTTDTLNKALQLLAANNDVEDIIVVAKLYNSVIDKENADMSDNVIKEIITAHEKSILTYFNDENNRNNFFQQIAAIFNDHNSFLAELTSAQLQNSISIMEKSSAKQQGQYELLNVEKIYKYNDKELAQQLDTDFNPEYMINYKVNPVQIRNQHGNMMARGTPMSGLHSYDTRLELMLALSNIATPNEINNNVEKLNFYSNKEIPNDVKCVLLQYDLWEIANGMNTISSRFSPKVLLGVENEYIGPDGVTKLTKNSQNSFTVRTNKDKTGQVDTGWHIDLENALMQINTILSSTDLSGANIRDILNANISTINSKAPDTDAIKQKILSIVAPINCIKNLYDSFWPSYYDNKATDIVVNVMGQFSLANNPFLQKVGAKLKNGPKPLFTLNLQNKNITISKDNTQQNINTFLCGNNNNQQPVKSLFGQGLEKLISDNNLYAIIDDAIKSGSVQQILKDYSKQNIEFGESTPQGGNQDENQGN